MGSRQPGTLVVAVITPLNNKNELDSDSLAKLLESVVAVKSSVLINSIYSGEGRLLPGDTRKTLISQTIEFIGARIPVLAGITGSSSEETIENAKYVQELCDKLSHKGAVFLFDAPLWYHSNRGLPAHYRKLAEVTALPVLVSNSPSVISSLRRPLKRYNIRTAVLKKLSGNTSIIGLEHSGDLNRFINYTMAVRERHDFYFYDGNELNFLNSPSTSGVISVGANLLPKEWKEVVDTSLFPDDSRKENVEYCKKLWEMREKLKRFYTCYRDNPVSLIKACLLHKGIIASDAVADKRTAITQEEKEKIFALLED